VIEARPVITPEYEKRRSNFGCHSFVAIWRNGNDWERRNCHLDAIVANQTTLVAKLDMIVSSNGNCFAATIAMKNASYDPCLVLVSVMWIAVARLSIRRENVVMLSDSESCLTALWTRPGRNVVTIK
jgi:hypothetical protein